MGTRIAAGQYIFVRECWFRGTCSSGSPADTSEMTIKRHIPPEAPPDAVVGR